MTAILREVEKTFTFEEQRVEINELALDVYNLKLNYIGLTDFRVDPKPASGTGSLTYAVGVNATTGDPQGVFDYTPPDLSAFIVTETDPTVPTHVKGITQQNITDWNNAYSWGDHALEGYLKSISALSINQLSDVSITNPQNEDLLQYNITNQKWENWTPNFLTSYTETDPTVPTHVKNITQQNITDWNNKSDFDGDYNSLTNKPDIGVTIKDETSGVNLGLAKTLHFKGFGVQATGLGDEKDIQINGGIQVQDEGNQLSPTTYAINFVGAGVTVTGTDATKTVTIPGGGGSSAQADWDETSVSDPSYIQNKPTLFSGSYTDLTNKPALFSGNYNDLTNKPFIPTDLNGLSDVTITGTPTTNYVLKYNGTQWTPQPDVTGSGSGASSLFGLNDCVETGLQSNSGEVLRYNGSNWTNYDISVDIPQELDDLNDVSNATPSDGQVLKWNQSQQLWIPSTDLTTSGGTGITLSDLSVTNNVAGTPSKLEYDDNTGTFAYTPPDLSGYSTFDGDYNSLTNKPFIPAAQIQSDWGQSNNSAVDFIKNKPTLFSGDYNSLTNKPSLVSVLNDLTDVNTTGAVNGKILKYNGTSWEIADDSGTGGGANVTISDTAPSNPSTGDLWWASDEGQLKIWYDDGVGSPSAQWVDTGGVGGGTSSGGSGANVSISDTAPSNPTTGDLWWKSDEGQLKIYYDDGSGNPSTQWVDTGGVGGGSAGGGGGISLTDLSIGNELSPNDNGGISYDDTTGEFKFQPAADDTLTFNHANSTTSQLLFQNNGLGTTYTCALKAGTGITFDQSGGNGELTINSSGGSSTPGNTWVTYLNGQPRYSQQTAANNYQEVISYQTASNTGPGGIDLTGLCDGNNGSYVNMGSGHANMSYLWLSQSQLTDVVKITIGFDGHGWIGYGNTSGISTDSANLLRVDNGQAYGANGVTGSPTEIILWDSTSPAYSGQLQSLTFVEYPDVNGTGGSNRGAGSRCHVYYFKVTRSVDNVLTEITYTAPGSGGSGIQNIVEDTTPQLGGTLDTNNHGINFADNVEMRLGTGNGAGGDGRIKHDGSKFLIDNPVEGTIQLGPAAGGHVEIWNNTFRLKNGDGTKTYMMTNHQNAKEVSLYFDGNKTFETSSDGIQVYNGYSAGGMVSCHKLNISSDDDAGNDAWIQIGSSADLKLYHDSTDSYINNTTGALKLVSPNGINIGGLTYPQVNGSSGEVLTSDGSGGISWQASSGGGGSTPNLQNVTDQGKITTNDITAAGFTSDGDIIIDYDATNTNSEGDIKFKGGTNANDVKLTISSKFESINSGTNWINRITSAGLGAPLVITGGKGAYNNDGAALVLGFSAFTDMPYLIGLDDDFGYLTELYGGGNKVFTTQYDGVQPIGALYDKDDQKGTPGQVLSSTSTALDWIDLPWLDVTNWSATPDDNVGTGKTGTVNRNAFQKAIGSLANKGGIIYVPHGDYPIQGTINIINTGNADDGNVGDGGGIVIMGPNFRVGAADSEGARLIAQTPGEDIFKITNVRNVEIKQLAFDSAVTRTGGSAIHCYSNTNTQQIKLERLYIRQQFGGIKMDGHSISILRDIEMRHFNDIANSYGLMIAASEGGSERVDQIRCQNVLIDGEVVGGNSNPGNAGNNTVGIQIKDFTNSVWFDHCVANRCKYGMDFHTSMPSGGSGNPGSFFRVNDCDFDTNSFCGINVEGGSFIWVNSPYISSNKYNGLRTTSNFTGVLRINDADCRGNSEHGILLNSPGHKKVMINNPQCCENGASTWSGTGAGNGIDIGNGVNDVQIQGGQCGGTNMGETIGTEGDFNRSARAQSYGIHFDSGGAGTHHRCTVAFVDCTDNATNPIQFNVQAGDFNYLIGVAGNGNGSTFWN